ncbi:hypothetical protein MSAN_02265200 [Mycena sanguinolenta]|uniref:Uncharacterized protein n=1 Tax=Mycena sanguinolenta TaxID=230812 RepID=A0A8H7CIC3_9AGAR|nr:hypothetical protein MSAN_02265200 [Mycena sanguinolenta]
MEHRTLRSSWQFSSQRCRSSPISSSLESNTWGMVPALEDGSGENANSISRTDPGVQYPPPVPGQLSSHPRSVSDDRKSSGFVSMYTEIVSPIGPTNYMPSSMPHAPSHSAAFSLWDDSLVDLVVDRPTDFPYHPNLPTPYTQRPAANVVDRALAKKNLCALSCHLNPTLAPQPSDS